MGVVVGLFFVFVPSVFIFSYAFFKKDPRGLSCLTVRVWWEWVSFFFSGLRLVQSSLYSQNRYFPEEFPLLPYSRAHKKNFFFSFFFLLSIFEFVVVSLTITIPQNPENFC